MMNSETVIENLMKAYPVLLKNRQSISESAAMLADAFRNGRKLLCCGNGGSASDSLHIVGELMKQFVVPRKIPADVEANLKTMFDDGEYISRHLQGALPAIALVGSSAIESAFTNDCAPDLVFAQQVLGLGKTGDILLGITTSGNSRNVVYAAKVARAKGMKVIALTGEKGGEISEYADILLNVPGTETFKIQELHLPVYHALCMAVEIEIYG